MTYENAFDLFVRLVVGKEWAERKKKNKWHIFRDPSNTWVDERVKIGNGTIIFHGCCILGETKIGKRCVIWPNATILNCVLEDDVMLGLPILKDSRVGKNSVIGGTGELNRCKIGKNVKMVHYGYLGDTEVGDNAIIGAGVITANFDGIADPKAKQINLRYLEKLSFDITKKKCLCRITADDIPPGLDSSDIALLCEDDPDCPRKK